MTSEEGVIIEKQLFLYRIDREVDVGSFRCLCAQFEVYYLFYATPGRFCGKVIGGGTGTYCGGIELNFLKLDYYHNVIQKRHQIAIDVRRL